MRLHVGPRVQVGLVILFTEWHVFGMKLCECLHFVDVSCVMCHKDMVRFMRTLKDYLSHSQVGAECHVYIMSYCDVIGLHRHSHSHS